MMKIQATQAQPVQTVEGHIDEPIRRERGKLVWVSNIHIHHSLDIATWFETAASLQQLGWQVTLIVEGPCETLLVNGVEVICIPRAERYLMGQVSYHSTIVRYLRRHWSEINVILYHQTAAMWILPLRLQMPAKPRPILVMDTRDLSDVSRGDWKAQLRNRYSDFAHAASARWADGQTTITHKMVDLVGIPHEKLLGIWPSGVTLSHFEVAQQLRQWPREYDPIRLVYVGILLEKRNLLPLAQAVVHANAQGMNIHFSLYGDGAFRPVLEKFASEHDCIEVLQPIQREEVPRVLGAVHVGVTSLPAVDDVKYAASSPIKLFEYLAAGMPILATANACHTDVVGDRRYAFWIDRVDNADMLRALTNIWQQRHALQALGAEAAADAAGWTWDAAARKLDIALCLGLERLWSPLSPGCAATI